MRARPRTKASRKRIARVKEARRIAKKYRNHSPAGVQKPNA